LNKSRDTALALTAVVLLNRKVLVDSWTIYAVYTV